MLVLNILVDVRRDAYSKQYNNNSGGLLSRSASEAQIKYIHMPELGVDYRLRQELKIKRDYGTFFKTYAEYIAKNPELSIFLADLSKEYIICLMCYEKDYNRCHRLVLSKKLEELGVTFNHI